ncbi:MAG: phasin family protein [Pseudomonadota bacterium]
MMSVLENQFKMGRELFEINTHVARRMTEITGEGIKQYLDTNQEFARKLTDVRDVSSFFELQREYGQTLYSGVSERLQTRGEVVREAIERSGEVIRGAFTTDAEASEEKAA